MSENNVQKTAITFWDILRSAGSWRLKIIKLLDHTLGFCVASCLPSLTFPRHKVDHIKTMLIIRPGGMGDAVFLLPVLNVLKAQGIQVDILCEKRNQGVFEAQRHLIRNIFHYTSWTDINEAAQQDYDVVVDTEQWHYASAIIAYGMKAPLKIGFGTRPKRAKLFHHRVSYQHNEYELHNINALFQLLGLKAIPETLKNSFTFSESAISQGTRHAVALFWGGSIIERRLDRASVIQLVRQLASKYEVIFLLGGKDIEDDADVVASQFDGQVVNHVGRLSLLESAKTIKQCCLFVGTDSGLLHVAVALGVPSVGIFGPGNIHKWGAEIDIIDCRHDDHDQTLFGYSFVEERNRTLTLSKGFCEIF